ncbi:TPA: hypothetical protein ACIVM6_004727, partial [Salmonella enterica subsp. salamae serovar 21:z10:z6]
MSILDGVLSSHILNNSILFRLKDAVLSSTPYNLAQIFIKKVQMLGGSIIGMNGFWGVIVMC